MSDLLNPDTAQTQGASGAGPTGGKNWEEEFTRLKAKFDDLDQKHTTTLRKFQDYDAQAQAYMSTQAQQIQQLQEASTNAASGADEDEFGDLDESVQPLAKMVKNMASQLQQVTTQFESFQQGHQKEQYVQKAQSRQQKAQAAVAEINASMAKGAPLVSIHEVLGAWNEDPHSDVMSVAKALAEPKLAGFKEAGFEIARQVQRGPGLGNPQQRKPVWTPPEGPKDLEDLGNQAHQFMAEAEKLRL